MWWTKNNTELNTISVVPWIIVQLCVKVLGQIQQALLKITSTLQTKVNRLFYQEYSGAAAKHETVTLEATMQLCSNPTDALNVFYSS